MKILKTILIVIAILLLIVLAFFFIKNKMGEEKITPPDTSLDIELSPEINAQQLCYIWNTEAGDSAKLSIDIRADKVIGEIYLLLAKNEPKTGIFKGNVSPVDPKTSKQTINALWESKKGATTRKEEVSIIFGGGIANIGSGEMKDKGDGIYIYANPAKLSYAPNLQQTDCGDKAMD